MNKYLIFIIFVLYSCSVNTNRHSETINVMTYNIRLDVASDSLNSWNYRKEAMISLFDKYLPDIIGIQEGLHHQTTFLNNRLMNHKYIGVGRDDGKTKGEYSAIFIDTTKFEIVSDSTFWLSDKPDSVSVGWDAALERICTYGLLKVKKTEKHFWVFNTHYDHRGKLARQNSSKLIVNRIKSVNSENYPVILMGDFNSTPDSKPINTITSELKDGYLNSNNDVDGPVGTFTGFKPDAPLTKRIDYIFFKNLQIINFNHINDKSDSGNFISDHLPVFAKISLK